MYVFASYIQWLWVSLIEVSPVDSVHIETNYNEDLYPRESIIKKLLAWH